MSHTPAPWHWSGDHTHRQFNIYQPSQQTQKHICTINNLSPEMLKGRNPETALANARLIAAAPEMLAALIGAEQCITRALPHLPPDTLAVFCGEWLADIREAIEKAAP